MLSLNLSTQIMLTITLKNAVALLDKSSLELFIFLNIYSTTRFWFSIILSWFEAILSKFFSKSAFILSSLLSHKTALLISINSVFCPIISLNLLFSLINQNFFCISSVFQAISIFIFLNKSIKSLSQAHSFTNLLNKDFKSTTCVNWLCVFYSFYITC